MKERPILFSAPMVRALLDGSKTQTRRVVKPRRDIGLGCDLAPHEIAGEINKGSFLNSPYGQPGDRLWVRETWRGLVTINSPHEPRQLGVARYVPDQKHCVRVEYLATRDRDNDPWRPSIHMPRWASRIQLEITDVRVERLNNISNADAEAEGIDYLRHIPDADETLCASQLFEILWDSSYGLGPWNANPWVWVIEFARVEAE